MSGLRIVLVRPKEPGNIGSAARAMKNFGLTELYLVKPHRKLGAQAYALAVHAKDVLDNAVVCDSVVEAVNGCRLVLGTTARPRASESFRPYNLRDAASTIPAEGTAVLFGPEDFGLSNADLDHCQGYLRIPTSDYSSLNLAQAVNIVAYEWFMAAAPENPDELPEPAPREELEAMVAQLLDTLHLIGYTDAMRHESAERLFRGIFNRAALTAREVQALRGLWRQTVWAAKHGPKGEGASASEVVANRHQKANSDS